MVKVIKWIKRNMGLCIVLFLTLILLAFISVIFVKLLKENSENKYGNRLEGINDVKISSETYDSIKTEVMDSGLVTEVSTRLQGKIVYTTIIFKGDTSAGKAKEIANNTLDNYTEDERLFYDFSYFLKWEGEESDKVIAGNKHHDLDSIAWIKD